MIRPIQLAILILVTLGFSTSAIAEIRAGIQTDNGNTAWTLIACTMALFMTPGLAFFYGGMVRTKNVVSILFQNFMTIAIVGLLWAICGYSLVYSGDTAGLVGNLEWVFLNHVGQEPNQDYAPMIPHLLFMMYQCTGAIITPALITGAFAERVRFKSWLVVMVFWMIGVFVPIAHWVKSPHGWIHHLGAIDFAGGMMIHIAAGYAALVCAIIFGKRRDFGRPDLLPYDTGMVLLGSAMLLFGWLGFIAGSTNQADGIASHALTSTFLSCCASMVMWTMIDWIYQDKLSAIGAGIGTMVGLIVITPGAGYVTTQAAIFIGLLGGGICNFSCSILKRILKIDDTLNVFGCHGIGGTLGVILVGIFSSKDINPSAPDGLIYGNTRFFFTQFACAIAVALFSLIGTLIIVKAVNWISPLRVDDREEDAGLDATQHNEGINSNFRLHLVRNINKKKSA